MIISINADKLVEVDEKCFKYKVSYEKYKTKAEDYPKLSKRYLIISDRYKMMYTKCMINDIEFDSISSVKSSYRTNPYN